MRTLYVCGWMAGVFAAAIVVAEASASAQVAESVVRERGLIDDDFYAAGETVDVRARVNGDVIAAGRTTRIEGDVRQDVMVAGRRVTIGGTVGDDLRAAGEEVEVTGAVRDDAALAGRSVRLGPEATVGGATWVAGRDVAIAGELRGPLEVAARTVSLSGEIAGDVDVRAENVEILPGTRIAGELRYRGPGEPQIAADASIEGRVTTYREEGPRGAGAMRFGLYLLTVGAAGAVLLLVFPRFTLAAARGAVSSPWKSLGVGLLSFVATPIVAIALMAIVVGVWIGLPLLGAYIALLPVALLVGIFVVSLLEARLLGWDMGRKGLALAAFGVALLVLGLIGMVPVAGGVVFALVVLIGLGAVVREAFGRFRRAPA